jgi:hypothetical protein
MASDGGVQPSVHAAARHVCGVNVMAAVRLCNVFGVQHGR